jgi:hypothetical protein
LLLCHGGDANKNNNKGTRCNAVHEIADHGVAAAKPRKEYVLKLFFELFIFFKCELKPNLSHFENGAAKEEEALE